MTAHNVEYETYRAIAINRYGRSTPFRLGVAVGEAMADLPAPTMYGTRAERCYYEGRRLGRITAVMKANP